MPYDASIYRHVYNPLVTAKVHFGISREQGWRPGTNVNSASQREIDAELIMDRLLREYLTRKSPWE